MPFFIAGFINVLLVSSLQYIVRGYFLVERDIFRAYADGVCLMAFIFLLFSIINFFSEKKLENVNRQKERG